MLASEVIIVVGGLIFLVIRATVGGQIIKYTIWVCTMAMQEADHAQKCLCALFQSFQQLANRSASHPEYVTTPKHST